MPQPKSSNRIAAFIENRLSGGSAAESEFWRGQTINEVIRSCLFVGALATSGRRYLLRELDSSSTAGIGFDALDGGPATLYSVFDGAMADVDCDATRSVPGSTGALGRFCSDLAKWSSTPLFYDLRQATAKFLVDRKMVRLTDRWVLGVPTPPRNYESISTLATELKTDADVLRATLIFEGLVDPALAVGRMNSKICRASQGCTSP